MKSLKLVRAKEIQEKYGISRYTLGEFEKQGKLKVYHTAGGSKFSQRRYLEADILALVGLEVKEEN